MKFLVEVSNFNRRNHLNLDFCWHLVQSIDYLNTFKQENHELKFTSSIESKLERFIPVGSLQFVLGYIKTYFPNHLLPMPRNIPSCLMLPEFMGRNVFLGTEKDVQGLKFVKSSTEFKSLTGIYSKVPRGNYIISDIIDIQAEYRGFVHNNQIKGIQYYSGDCTIFPDCKKIKEMVSHFANHNPPPAYTLDVAISDSNNTVIIEIHDFFSCGLYGFEDYEALPYMFSHWWHWYLNTHAHS